VELTFVLDQGDDRTYPANTRYLTTPERYERKPGSNTVPDELTNEADFFQIRGVNEWTDVH
jgi:hypothetical protein